MVTLDSIRGQAVKNLYPRQVLRRNETALILFAAAFYGRQDAIWAAKAGMHGTCVDLDKAKMATMQAVYPQAWEFEVEDVFDFILRTDRQWDVVSVDWPTPYFERVDEFLPLFCLLARRAVVFGTGADTSFVVPEGWTVTDEVRRSEFLAGGVWWTVVEHA